MQKVDVHPQDKQETQRKEDECRRKKDAGFVMDVGGRSGSAARGGVGLTMGAARSVQARDAMPRYACTRPVPTWLTSADTCYGTLAFVRVSQTITGFEWVGEQRGTKLSSVFAGRNPEHGFMRRGRAVTAALPAQYTSKLGLSPSLMRVLAWFFLACEQADTCSDDMRCRNAQTRKLALYPSDGYNFQDIYTSHTCLLINTAKHSTLDTCVQTMHRSSTVLNPSNSRQR